MSAKKKVLDALKLGAGSVPVAYGYTKIKMPYIVFNLVSNVGDRLSNQRHSQTTRWQIDYYSAEQLDVQSSPALVLLQDALEESRLLTNEWLEVLEVDEKTEIPVWRYMLEVTVYG